MKCSVIIPSYNRPEAAKRCVAACLALVDPGGGIEVILIDDGSEPPVPAMAGIIQVSLKNGGPAQARNAGLRIATGDFIAFTDDDCVPHRTWLITLLRAHLQQPNALLGGQTLNALPSNLYSTASQCLVDYLYDVLPRRAPRFRFFTSNNCAASRASLIAHGGFNETFPLAAAEDRDLSERFEEHLFVPEARVDHWHDLSPQRFFRQHFTYGRGDYHLSLARACRRDKFQLGSKQFHTGLLLALFRDPKVTLPILILFLLLIAQVASFAGFLYETNRKRS